MPLKFIGPFHAGMNALIEKLYWIVSNRAFAVEVKSPGINNENRSKNGCNQNNFRNNSPPCRRISPGRSWLALLD
jgi:hypothetical protein